LVASAPKGFGILQLFNSNEESMESTWHRFLRTKGAGLWTEVYQKQPGAFWSTCAYLIDREVLRPIVDKVAFRDPLTGWVVLKIVAGIKQPCRPKFTDCCLHVNGTFSFRFVDEPPCVWAPKGFQADSFIYALARTFVLSVPLITNGAGGNESTFHQDHVESIHESAFARQRKYINLMITGKVKPPSFAVPACKEPLPVGMTLYKRPVCLYDNHSASDDYSSVALFWINMKHHEKQRRNMESYLDNVIGIKHFRVQGFSAHEIAIPNDVMNHWEHKTCIYQSASNQFLSFNSLSPSISGLCGRGKGRNTIHDLGVTISHITAMWKAIYQNKTTSRYSLISEDDVVIPFDVNYEKLALSAPSGFGILRLFNSHEVDIYILFSTVSTFSYLGLA
jgi:hypothetical protein